MSRGNTCSLGTSRGLFGRGLILRLLPFAAGLGAIALGLLAAPKVARAGIYLPQPAINIFVAGKAEGRTYTGTGSDAGDTGTFWNTPAYNATTAGLLNSAGSTTSVSYTAAGVGGDWGGNNNANPVLNTIADANNPAQMTFTFGGLTAGDEYNLYAIMNCNAGGRTTYFAVGGSTQTIAQVGNGANSVITSPNVYREFTNLTPTGTGQIVVVATGPGGEFDANGFQLVPLAPLPSFTWAGTGGNSNWDSTTANWTSTSGSVWSNGAAAVFTDGPINTSITITGTGVSPAVVQFSRSATPYSFTGAPISGAGYVALSGSSLVTFSSSNTYSGGTTISTGTLVAGNNAALGTGSVTVNTPGVLDFNTATPSITSFTGNGNIVLVKQRQSTNLTISGTSQAISFTGPISQVASGTGSLTMAGLGSTLTLGGSNSTFSGGITVSAGTLASSAGRSAFGSGPIYLSGGGLSVTGTYSNAVNVTTPSTVTSTGVASLGDLSLGSSALSVGGGVVTFAGGTTLSTSATLNVPAGSGLVLAGPVSDGGSALTITVTGGGSVTLSGATSNFNGSQFQVFGSGLVEVGQNYTAPGPATGPLGSTPITLTNGTLVLGANSAAVRPDLQHGLRQLRSPSLAPTIRSWPPPGL